MQLPWRSHVLPATRSAWHCKAGIERATTNSAYAILAGHFAYAEDHTLGLAQERSPEHIQS